MKTLSLPAFALILALAGSASAQDHGHLNVGAVSTNQNAQLIFDNASEFSTTNGYVKTLLYATSGTYAGYYQGNVTLTALAATTAHLGPVPNAPALGSYIYVQLVSVDGPSGGTFSFWESGALSPTFSLLSGTTGTNMWRLSENNGSPGTDPFGHFHGRRLTASRPGIYTVGFRAYDLSTNGVAGGSIHTPSAVFKVHFQAGDNIHSITPNSDLTFVRFAARLGFNWQVQAADSVHAPQWEDVGEAVAGDDYFHQLSHETLASNRFYRLQGTPVLP